MSKTEGEEPNFIEKFFTKDRMEALKELLQKWVIFPYAVLITLLAGAVLNLPEYISKNTRGIKGDALDTLRFAVMFGYYLGVAGGLLVDYIPTKMSWYGTSALSACSYLILGLYFEGSMPQGFTFSFLIATFITLGVGANVAYMLAIVVCIKNYPRHVSSLLMALFVTLLMVCSNFDYSLHELYFKKYSFSTY